jgi:hypothetical protein
MLQELGAPLAAVQLVRCRACRSVYRDPWLTDEAMAPIYERLQPCHPQGMDRFTNPADVLEEGTVRGGAARLNAFLQHHVRPLARYGEFGCPLWGLLPYFERPRYRLLWGLVDAGADARLFGRSLGDVARTSRAPVPWLRRLAGMAPVPAPSACYWIAHGTRTFWGAACAYEGRACSDLLRVRGYGKVPAHADVPGRRLDVLSIIDCLDHFHDPVTLVRRLAAQARFLFIWTHGNAAGHRSVQHLINYTGEGLQRLAARCGCTVVARYPDAREEDDFGMLWRVERAGASG